MTWNRARPWLGTLARLLLGVVWIWDAWSKLRAPRTFVQAVRAYDATPEWLSKAIGYGLPVLEFCLGVLLVIGLAVRVAAAVSGVLLLVFLAATVQAAARGIELDCGCFGGGGPASGDTSYTLDILRGLGLLAVAAFLVLWSVTRLSIEEFVARHDHVEMPSAKRMRTEQGRRKYEAELEAKRASARSRDRYVTASVAGIVVLIAVIGIGVQAGRAKISGAVTATNATVANGVVFGKRAAATIDIYEDFQCPHCQKFEASAAKTLDADVRANRAQVRFHTLAFLDGASNGNRYSTRAANAALCASDTSVDDFVALHNVLFQAGVQPKEDSSGRSDTQLVKYGQQAGLAGADLTNYTSCVQDEQHKSLVAALTERASRDGVTGTLTVKVNGKQVTATLAALEKAIAAALVKGPKPNPSKTPSPTPSVTPSRSGSSSATPGGSSSARSSSSARPSSSRASSTPAKVTSSPAG